MGVKKNATFYCSAMLINKTDGSAVTSGTTSVYVTKDNGAQAAATNSATHKNNGLWQIELTNTEMNADVVNVTFVNSNAVNANVQISTDSSTNADLASVLVDILADTGTTIPAQISGLNDITAAEVKTAIEASGSSLAQILEDTNELQGDWEDGGRLDTKLDASAVSVTVLPIQSTVPAGEVSEQELTIYLNTAGTVTINVVDSDGNAVNISGVSSMTFVAFKEDDSKTTLFALDENSITVGGSGNSQAAVAYGETETATEGTYRWNLRDEDTPRLLGHGALNIAFSKDVT